MQLILKVWSDFLSLKWWEKLIVVLPVVILIIFSFLFGRWITKENEPKTNQQLLEQNKKLIDGRIDDWKRTKNKETALRHKLEEERKEINKKIIENRRTNEEIINEINNAHNVDELLLIAEELRTRHRGRARGNRINRTTDQL